MSSTDDPDRIRGEIERTRSALSGDVDALTDKVKPGRIVERHLDDVRAVAGRWKDAVMGTATGTAQSIGDVPGRAQEQARGNPLAAGLIAFGTGLLVSSLLPSSKRERELAAAAGEQAGALAQPVAQAVGDVAGELQEPAQQAVDSVKSVVADAGQAVAQKARPAEA